MEEKHFYYAGFWRRFVAYLIDQLLLGAVTFALFLPIYLIFGVGIFAFENWDKYDHYSNVIFTQNFDDETTAAFVITLIFISLVIGIISVVIQWLYYALMESSAKQATLGKMALNIKVTDMSGNRISFARATGRYFGKIISGMILNIGYIMAGFTEKKQALHDMMANCLVILDPPPYQYKGGANYEGSQNSTAQ